MLHGKEKAPPMQGLSRPKLDPNCLRPHVALFGHPGIGFVAENADDVV